MDRKSRISLSMTLLLAACGTLWGNIGVPDENSHSEIESSSTLTPFQPEGYHLPPAGTELPVPSEMDMSSDSQFLWISPVVPELLKENAILSGLQLVNYAADANIRLEISQGSDTPSASWIYALVAPFPTTTDGVSLNDILNNWAGIDSGPFMGHALWMEETTLAALSMKWGPPSQGSVSVTSGDMLIDSAWLERPAWAIVPFEKLEPRWKVINVDGQSPIHNDFDISSYPLKINFSFQPALVPLLATNRDPGKLTVLAMTGVTALVRATADRMERNGILYPGEEIRSVLRSADIAHISNEIPFMEGCPTPDPWTESLRFCSDPGYISLLEDIGTDVVELTGNHLMDYGPQAALTTFDMYDQREWQYFGGGRDLQDSFRPALMEDHGNKLAFIGCNLVGPPADWSTDGYPGSTPCDFASLEAEIANLRQEGYLPIMTFQYQEYYQPVPSDKEREDFLEMASAGAVIVSGSQSHVPAAIEFSGGSIIHYGLGNLFFDQMSFLMPDGSRIYDTRNVIVDRHVIYDGRYISTELLTYIIEDYSRPRLMSEPERQEFLQNIFSAGGW